MENMIYILYICMFVPLLLSLPLIQKSSRRIIVFLLMHGICTAAVGYGMSFVKKRKKLFYCGTFALLLMAIIYHGIFNMLVQSDSWLKYFGFILPLTTYIPVVYALVNRVKNKKKEVQAES